MRERSLDNRWRVPRRRWQGAGLRMQLQGQATQQSRDAYGYARSCSEDDSAWGQKAKRQRHEGWWSREGPCRHPPALNKPPCAARAVVLSFAFRARQSYRCWRLSSSACSPPRMGVRNPGGEEEHFVCWCERLKLPA